MANTHSHLTLSDRIYIEQALERRMKFKDIALFIEKDPTTVSKEIRRHRIAKESERKTALCENRSICTKNICAARAISISSVGNAPCIIANLTVKTTPPLCVGDLPLHPTSAMAVGFETVGRI